MQTYQKKWVTFRMDASSKDCPAEIYNCKTLLLGKKTAIQAIHQSSVSRNTSELQRHCILFFVSAPECRDIETALYDLTSVRTYVFSVLCSIFQYVIKRWSRALQLRERKSD